MFKLESEKVEFQSQPIAKAEFLIRKPVAEVFEAFIDPNTITKFWFDRSTGRLENGKTVRWFWDLYNASCEVRVKDIVVNRRIFIEWDAGTEHATTFRRNLYARSDDSTYVTVKNEGFVGDGDEIVAKALDSTGGFTLVLAAAKAYLEHGIQLNLVADRL